MLSVFLFFLGICVFPRMLSWHGTLKPYVDLFAIIASISCIGYGIFLLI